MSEPRFARLRKRLSASDLDHPRHDRRPVSRLRRPFHDRSPASRSAGPLLLRQGRLEARYGWLLRLYPADRPRDEMLDVLLAGGRPFHREVMPLVVGGLRARSGGHQPIYVRWLYAARVAAIMLIVLMIGLKVPHALDHHAVEQALLWLAIATVCGLGAGRPAALPVLAAGALTVADAAAWQFGGLAHPDPWQLGVTYVVIAALLSLPGPRTPAVSPLLPVAAVLTTGEPVSPVAIVVTILLWSVIDERMLIATGLLVGGAALEETIVRTWQIGLGEALTKSWTLVEVLAAFLTAGGLLAWRRARI